MAVSLDVMPHKIKQKTSDILVTIYHGDMLIQLMPLPDRSARSAFNAFSSHWISIFDASTYVIVDRGSNISAEWMKDRVHGVESLLLRVSTEATWGIGLNEGLHRYFHRSNDRLLRQKG